MSRGGLAFAPVLPAFDDPARPLVVTSAVAFVEGGPLTILRQAVAAARDRPENHLFLVADADAWEPSGSVGFVAVPWARRSYVRRLWAEYVAFPRWSRAWRPDVWLSLHDTTPPVRARVQAVYCQNPLPAWRATRTDLRLHPKEVLRSIVYPTVYRAFARRNAFVIAQLGWFARFVGELMRVPDSRLVVAAPDPTRADPASGASAITPPRRSLECVYVALPRVFKNVEEAVALCEAEEVGLTLTIAGNENAYARRVRAMPGAREVRFVGALSHEDALATIVDADVVLFPSRLETYGLPIREALDLGRPLVLPVRPWTVEIASGAPNAHFYRGVAEGRRILAAIAQGREPEGPRPRPVPGDLRRVGGFAELYDLLAEAASRS